MIILQSDPLVKRCPPSHHVSVIDWCYLPPFFIPCVPQRRERQRTLTGINTERNSSETRPIYWSTCEISSATPSLAQLDTNMVYRAHVSIMLDVRRGK